jgi:DNA invertase Pin-like site-specific DNA recombinase
VLIGYARVSKADGSQSLDLQRDALVDSGVEEAQIYTDKASGKKDDRPGLEACLKALRKGDVLVIWKLDRLGRSLQHLVHVVADLTKRGVGLKVLTGQGAQIDTTTPPAACHSAFLRRWLNLRASLSANAQ